MNSINQLNSEGHREGYWEVYFKNGKIMFKGNYSNGKRDGYCESYFKNGMIKSKGHYKRGAKF